MNNGQLETDLAERAVVEQIREFRANGMTLQAIASILNDEAIPTKRGGKWHPSTITYILDRMAS